MLRWVLLLVVTALIVSFPAAAQFTRSNDDSCDIGVAPAATLLLPYFEVDFTAPEDRARTTLLSVTNVSAFPQIAHVTLWTDWAYPVLTFNVFLTGYDVQSINLYDVLAKGRITQTSMTAPPGLLSVQEGSGNVNFLPSARVNCSGPAMPGMLPPATLADLQTSLTTGRVSFCGTSRIGGTHTWAIGYATIDLVADCTPTLPTTASYHAEELLYDNVLIGDFQIVDPNPAVGNLALGEPMVHIRAIPEGGTAGSMADTNLPYTFYDRYTPTAHRTVDRRQPLPSAFAARYIQGGATGFLTDFQVWREGLTQGDAACSSYINNRAITVNEVVRFDERENPTTTAPQVIICTFSPGTFTMPATSSYPSTSTSFPPLTSGDVAGWMYMNLHANYAYDPSRKCGRMRASQNWVVVGMEAEGRYATAQPAVPLGNGCSPFVTSPTDRLSNRIGPLP